MDNDDKIPVPYMHGTENVRMKINQCFYKDHTGIVYQHLVHIQTEHIVMQ